MRTLKKTLCLVLVLAMMVGLCAITASAVDFTDEAQITYKEAVGVLSGIGVINGKPDGANVKFDPAGTLTRAEAAKIITYVLGYEDIKGTATFDDTKGHWAEGPIALCATEGIVAGVGGNKFNPEGTLTGSAWAKMLLCALGYNAEFEGMVGDTWEIGVAKTLKDTTLLDGIKTWDATANINRETACQMAFNALWEVCPVFKEGMKIEGAGISVTDIGSYTGVKAPLAGRVHNLTAGAAGNDEFGRPTTTYQVNGEDVYVGTDTPTLTYNGTLDKKALDAIDKAAKGDYDFTAAPNYTYNTNAVAWAKTDLYDSATSDKAFTGYNIEIYADNNKVVTDVVVTEWTLAQVQKEVVKGTRPVAVIDDTITYNSVNVVDDEKKTDDMYDTLASIADNTYIAVLFDGADILDCKEVTTVEGKLTKLNKAATVANFTTTAVMGGKSVAYANTAAMLTIVNSEVTACADLSASALKVGDEGTFFLDPNGNVIGYAVDVAAADPEVVVYFVKGYTKSVTDDYGTTTNKYFLQCVDAEGKEVNYPSLTDESAAAAGLKKVTLDNKGNATLSAATGAQAPGATTLTGKEIKIAANHYYDNVKFVFVSGSGASLKLTIKDGAQAVTALPVEYIAAGAGTNKTVAVVYVAGTYTAPAEAPSKDIVFVTGDTASSTEVLVKDKDGKETKAYEKDVYIDGKEATIVVAAATAIADGYYEYTKNGDIYVLATKAAANLKAATAVTNMYNGLITTADVTDMAVDGATVVNASGNTKVPTSAAALATTETVALVLSADSKTISIIYVTASTR